MTRLLFFLLAVGVPLASANNCFSVRNGDWHSSATWIGCGGGVPGDGDSANISHAVVIEGDLGTVNNGIRTVKLSGTATLSVDGVAPHAVYFASTGSTLFTDLFGFVTCGRFINLNLNGGSAATKLTINSGDNVHGWFMADGGDVASSQCGTAGGGGTWTVSYADISNCGDVAAQVRCFEYSSRNPPATTDLLTISNNRLTGLPAGIVGARGFGYAFTFSNNYVSNAGCISRTYSAGIAYISSTVFDAGASGEFNLNENVFRNPAADC